MKCPHCLTEIHPAVSTLPIGQDKHGYWSCIHQLCPSCKQLIVEIVCGPIHNVGQGFHIDPVQARILALPKGSTRPAPPQEVPTEFAEDYVEASMVIENSPKASAALSRRCLQHILRVKAGVKPQDLAKEIDEVIASNKLPSHLSEAIDAIRNIGNFAAHPVKSSASGSILEVETGEAEWNLDVLDGLFDFYFVQPEILKKRRAALDSKLASAGKPPMK